MLVYLVDILDVTTRKKDMRVFQEASSDLDAMDKVGNWLDSIDADPNLWPDETRAFSPLLSFRLLEIEE